MRHIRALNSVYYIKHFFYAPFFYAPYLPIQYRLCDQICLTMVSLARLPVLVAFFYTPLFLRPYICFVHGGVKAMFTICEIMDKKVVLSSQDSRVHIPKISRSCRPLLKTSWCLKRTSCHSLLFRLFIYFIYTRLLNYL